MNIDGQRHHRTANVEIIGEGQDGDEDLPQLEGHVVEQLHGLLFQVAGAPFGIQNFTNVLETGSDGRTNFVCEGKIQSYNFLIADGE